MIWLYSWPGSGRTFTVSPSLRHASATICAAWYSCGAAASGWVSKVSGRIASPGSSADATRLGNTAKAADSMNRFISKTLTLPCWAHSMLHRVKVQARS